MKFVKGQSGNPSGRKKLPEELRKYPRLVREEIQHMISKFAHMDAKALAELVDPDYQGSITGLERSIILNLLDKDKLPFILDRTIGKVVEVVETHNPYLEMPKDELIKVAETKLKTLKAGDDEEKV